MSAVSQVPFSSSAYCMAGMATFFGTLTYTDRLIHECIGNGLNNMDQCSLPQ